MATVWLIVAVGVGPVERGVWLLYYLTAPAAAVVVAWIGSRLRQRSWSWLRIGWLALVLVLLSMVGLVNPWNLTVIGAFVMLTPLAALACLCWMAVLTASQAQAGRWVWFAPCVVLTGLLGAATVLALLAGALIELSGDSHGPVRYQADSPYGDVAVQEQASGGLYGQRDDPLWLVRGSGLLRREMYLCANSEDPETRFESVDTVVLHSYYGERRIVFDPTTLAIVADTGRPNGEYCT